jgi:hypothetical protein
MLRLSLAAPPKIDKESLGANISSFFSGHQPKNNFTPGLALKIYIDNEASVNTMAMYSLNGQEEPSFFVNSFTTVLPEPEYSLQSALLQCSFRRAAALSGQPEGNIRAFSSDHMASVEANGIYVVRSKLKAPFELIFTPTAQAQALFDNTTYVDDFRAVLNKKGKNIKLYEVFARRTSGEAIITRIGFITAVSNFIASKEGDRMFFKHPKVHDNI